MPFIVKAIKVIGIVLAVIAVFAILDMFSYRYSLFYWMCGSLLILPLLFLRGRHFWLGFVSSGLLAVGLALSPIDIVVAIQGGQHGVRVLPTSYGAATLHGTVGYGCTVHGPPPRALVISL